MLSTSTPAGRIKLERFGKSSVVLAAVPGTEGKSCAGSKRLRAAVPERDGNRDQLSQSSGSANTVPAELARVSTVEATKAKPTAHGEEVRAGDK